MYREHTGERCFLCRTDIGIDANQVWVFNARDRETDAVRHTHGPGFDLAHLECAQAVGLPFQAPPGSPVWG